jgi:hypothetical protein
MSMNRLVDELATVALAQFDAQTRFHALATRGSASRGIELLDRADAVQRRVPRRSGTKGRSQ